MASDKEKLDKVKKNVKAIKVHLATLRAALSDLKTMRGNR